MRIVFYILLFANLGLLGYAWLSARHVNPDAELLVSGGDQVETAGTESQWTAFLAPKELRSYPWVATIGNHDVGSKAYEQHLWTPNTDRALSHYTTGANRSGGDSPAAEEEPRGESVVEE